MIILSLHWPIAAILFAANLIYVTIRFKTERSRKIKWILIGLYSVLLVKFVVFPIVLGGRFPQELYWNNILQLIPFNSIRKYVKFGTWPIQMLGNIGLLAPFAAMTYFYSNFGWKKRISWCILFPFLIEGTQLTVDLLTRYPCHVVDIDDVILNLAGEFLLLVIVRWAEKSNLLKKYSQSKG